MGLVTVMPLVLVAYVALSNSKDEGGDPRAVGSFTGSAEGRAPARAPRRATGLRRSPVWPAGKGSMPS